MPSLSKIFRWLLLLFVAASANVVAGQDIDVMIIADDSRTAAIRIEGRYRTGTTARYLSFARSRGSVNHLDRRFSDVVLRDGHGNTVSSQSIGGEYVADRGFASWSYLVDLRQVEHLSAAAHTSWLSTDGGILFLADLLPQFDMAVSAQVTFKTPRQLKYRTFEQMAGPTVFTIPNVEKAVFLLGTDLREKEEIGNGITVLGLSLSGEWQFTDDEAMWTVPEVFNIYERQFGSSPAGGFRVFIGKFPGNVPSGHWDGDTRGRTITVLSSDMPFKSQSLQRLHEQLRHEMFHLWIPEGVNLTGNYDWFYEGFALYQSLKLGVAVNRLRFEDYLDSLNQACAIDRRLGGRMSLIDASKNRWSGDNNSVVYARGMLVAFLSDLAMLEASNGKRSTDDIVREVYQKHSGTAAKQDGNASVIAIMKQRPKLVPIVDRYVTGSEKLDWTPFLTAAGLEATGPNKTALTTVAKPNGRQKKLLDKLGYNNWRKLSSTRK